MKQFLYLVLFTLCFSSVNAAVAPSSELVKHFETEPIVEALPKDMAQMAINDFLSLTPKKYKEMTGKRLGIKKTLQLKAAQKIIKKKTGKSGDIPKGLYIVLAIFGLGWLAMGIMDDWEGDNWWVCLLLYLACGLPGLIYSLIKMDEYY